MGGTDDSRLLGLMLHQLYVFKFPYLFSIQPPGPGDPLVDFYTVNVSSTDGQRLCGRQTTGGNTTSAVLDVTDCVLGQGSNVTYVITVEASNHGGQTTSTTSLSMITYYIYI